jgi:putative ABC transport system permease protein
MKRIVLKRREEKRLDAELRYHLEARVAELVAAGASEGAARRTVQMEFGGLEQIKEDCRTARRGSFVETVIQDVRYGARTLRKAPGFALIVIATLALGIGASTTVFSLVNAILVKPLPYPKAEQIVLPWLTTPAGVNVGSDVIPWGEVQFRMVTAEQKSFQWLAALRPDSFNLTGVGEPEMVDGIRTSADLFPSLGVSAALGRVFTQDEDRPGHEHEVALSDGLWRERFAGNPGVLGRAVELNGAAYTIVGVMPSGFEFPRAEEMPPMLNFPRETRLWVPAAIAPQPKGGPAEMAVMGRLRPDVSMAQAQAEMDVIARHAEAKIPGLKGWFNTRMTPLTRQLVGDTRRPLLLILCAVCVVLLIACSNVANLLLARSLAREKEFTLRTALGAGRGRLVRQILTEGLLLAGRGRRDWGFAGIGRRCTGETIRANQHSAAARGGSRLSGAGVCRRRDAGERVAVWTGACAGSDARKPGGVVEAEEAKFKRRLGDTTIAECVVGRRGGPGSGAGRIGRAAAPDILEDAGHRWRIRRGTCADISNVTAQRQIQRTDSDRDDVPEFAGAAAVNSGSGVGGSRRNCADERRRRKHSGAAFG